MHLEATKVHIWLANRCGDPGKGRWVDPTIKPGDAGELTKRKGVFCDMCVGLKSKVPSTTKATGHEAHASLVDRFPLWPIGLHEKAE